MSRGSSITTIVSVIFTYDVEENIMSHMKRLLTHIEETNRLSDVPLASDYEAIWLQDEIELALDAGDLERASQLASLLDAHTLH